MSTAHEVESEIALARPYSVSGLMLTNYRNYDYLKLSLDASSVVLTGANGSGKTNILEAISFLSPGRGLRKIKLNEVGKIKDGVYQNWSVAANVKISDELSDIGTGVGVVDSNKRTIKIDGDIIKSQAELTSAFSVMWLTPQMDGLFIGGSSERRKFLDRLVYNFDPEHASRVYSYEYSMRERAKLLQNGGDSSWLSVLEAKMAERAVSIAIARLDAVTVIQESIMQLGSAFPKALIYSDGIVEKMIGEKTAIVVEEELKKLLFDNRGYDKASGRTNAGVHRSDFVVTHTEKQMPAGACSTGEQKALLLSIILAEARAKAVWKGSVPVLLLDEVVAHLDENRRNSLFELLLELKAQVWMTGTDTVLFDGLQNKAQFLSVNDGIVG